MYVIHVMYSYIKRKTHVVGLTKHEKPNKQNYTARVQIFFLTQIETEYKQK